MSRVLSVAFDLGWASPTGYAVVAHDGNKEIVVDRGCIQPPKHRDKVTTEVQLKRAVHLVLSIEDMLKVADAFVDVSDQVVVTYEDPTGWILAAASSGRRVNRGRSRGGVPVTKNSLMGAVFPVVCMWVGVGLWALDKYQGQYCDEDVAVGPMNTRHARSAFGVDYWANQRHGLVDEILADKNLKYDGSRKAMVGAAVTGFLMSELGFSQEEALPATDHEADALLMALVALDEQKSDVATSHK